MTEKSAYPAERWVRIQFINSTPQLAWAPDAVADHLEAYDSSLFMTKEAAKADIKEFLEGVQEAREREGEFFDAEAEAEDEGYTLGVIHEDGSIELKDHGLTLTRERLFADFGVVDPFATAPKP